MRRRIFGPEHELFRDQARRFFKTEIGPRAASWRAQGYVDQDAFRKAGDNGFLLMWADPRYGGLGIADFRYEQILSEENIRFGEIGFFMALHSRLVAPYIATLGTEEQRQRFLPGCATGETILGIAMTEPDAGSDLGGMRTRAVPVKDDWILSGTKTYISNGQIGDLFVVAARTSLESGRSLGLFLVERGMQGFSRGRNLKKLGLHAQDTSELHFDDVRVPARNVLGDPTQGFTYLTKFLPEERLINAVGSLAHAQCAFDITLEYVRERRAFGQPIGTFQNSRFRLAEMRAQLDAAQCFVDHAVLEHNEGLLTAELAAEVKMVATETENRVIDECVQLHGGAGYMQEQRICRMYADARISKIYAGTSEIMREIVGRSLGLDDRGLQR